MAGWNLVDNNNNLTDSDQESHGTMMASIIGATCNNGLDIAGGACNVRVMPVRIEVTGGASTPMVTEGVYYAVDNGARVINISMGAHANQPNMTDDVGLRAAIAYARSRNVIVVAGTGNDGAQLNWLQDPDLILVAGTDINDGRAGFSNYGPIVTLSAPATCYAIRPDSLVYVAGGTSCSTAIVSATAAMMLTVNPSLTFNQVKSILQSTAVHLAAPGMGAGRVNTLAAVQAAAAQITAPAPAQAPASPSTATTPAGPPALINTQLTNNPPANANTTPIKGTIFGH